MGERIRLQQVDALREGEPPLTECSLHIEDGEILIIAGEQDSGSRLLLEVISGRQEIRKGKLYYREERLRNRRIPEEKVLRVDAGRKMTGELTNHQNLECMGPGLRGIRKDTLTALFPQLGIESGPERITGTCPERDRLLLWFALALVREIPVICLDLTGFSLGEEDLQGIRKAAEVCRGRGMSVVLFTDRKEHLPEGGDRIAWMSGGAVQRIFRSAEEWQRAFPALPEEKTEKRITADGSFCLLTDPGWPMGCSLPDYLKRHPELADMIPGGVLPVPDQKRCFYVPEDSHRHLMEQETIGKNLILTLSARLGTRFGFVDRDMERFLEQEFRREFRIPPQAENVHDLTAAQKKLLTLYRVFLLQPEQILLENPLLPFDSSRRREAAEWIRRMAGNSFLLVSGKDPELISLFRTGK